MFKRRNDVYIFESEKDLISFFSRWLSKKEIKDICTASKKNFVTRHGCTKKETFLQYLKRCEFNIVKKIRKGEPATYTTINK